MAQAPRSLARRLHSLSGVVPVGVFLAFHLYTNAEARGGAEAYNAAARRLQELPLRVAIEIVFIAAPLVFHALYGLFLTAVEPTATVHVSSGRRALSIAQRGTGMFLFVFILFHLWTTRLVQLRDHESVDLFHLMQAALASAWIRGAYFLGLLAAAFHLSAGLWTFAETWAIAGTPRARRLAAVVAVGVFVTLSAIGFASLDAFRL